MSDKKNVLLLLLLLQVLKDNQAMVEVIVTQEKMPITSAFTIGEYVDMDKAGYSWLKVVLFSGLRVMKLRYLH